MTPRLPFGPSGSFKRYIAMDKYIIWLGPLFGMMGACLFAAVSPVWVFLGFVLSSVVGLHWCFELFSSLIEWRSLNMVELMHDRDPSTAQILGAFMYAVVPLLFLCGLFCWYKSFRKSNLTYSAIATVLLASATWISAQADPFEGWAM